jgi:hypothetical protein
MSNVRSHRLNNSAAPPHAPMGMLLAIALATLILVGAIVAWLGWQFSLLSPGVAAVLRTAIYAIPLLLVSGGGIIALRIAWRRWGAHEYIRADKVTALTRAQRQTLPRGLTSLHLNNSSRPQLTAPVGEDTRLLELAPPTVPTFAQLLDQGKVGPGNKLLLGFRDGQPIEGSWSDLYSTGVGGMTGSGKSWLAAFLVGQSAAAGARIILIDPHAGDPQSLATRLAPLSASYMCDTASTPPQIESALKLAADKLDGRKAGRGGTWPLLLICDEWTSLLRGKLGDLLTATTLDYAEQGRKYGCFALLAAQAWQVDAAGPVRDRLASHYTMRTRGDQFRYQMGLRGSAPLDTLFLKPGEAYFLSTRGELGKVCIPQMADGDLARCAALIDRPAAAAGQPFGFHRVTTHVTPSAELVTARRQDGDTAATSATPVTTASGSAISPEAARVLDLLHAGNDLPAIVKELRGVAPREGRRYMTALAEVTDLLRQATKGG